MLRAKNSRMIILVLCAVMTVAAVTVTTAYAADIWYCPKCGLLNTDNYCPRDGTAKPVLDYYPSYPTSTAYPAAATTYYYPCPTATVSLAPWSVSTPVWGLTTMRLATRTGPATEFTEPGTFRVENQYVKIYSIAYDINKVPWVQCEITYGGKTMRVYTGLKRFDTTTFDLSAIPEEWNHGGTMITTGAPLRYGPGYDYTDMQTSVVAGMWVTVTNEENGWYQIEFEQSDNTMIRGWIPGSYTNWK